MLRLFSFSVGLVLGALAYSLLSSEREPASSQEGQGSPQGRCAAVTGSGSRCTRPAEPGSRFCWQHG